jgi:anti-sigma B factor antagonist
MLIGGLTTMKKADGSMKLSGVTEKIQSLLVITKLVTIFETYNNIDEAVASFAK